MRRAALAVALGGVLAAVGHAQEGGIEIFSGEMLFAEGVHANLGELYRRRHGREIAASGLQTTREDLRTVLGLQYGIAADFTLGALVPFLRTVNDSQLAGRETVNGLGDVALLAKYRLVNRQWKRGGFGLSTVAGVELPTGRTDVRSDVTGMRLAPTLQPGTGVASPFLALSATLGVERSRFDFTVFHKLNPEGSQGLERGDFTAITLAGGYRVLHTKYPGPTIGVGTGLRYRHQGRGKLDGARIDASGSDILSVLGRVVYHPQPQYDVILEVDAPVVWDYNDAASRQLRDQVRLTLNFGLRF